MPHAQWLWGGKRERRVSEAGNEASKDAWDADEEAKMACFLAVGKKGGRAR